jgi:hypothetical protein
MKVTVLAPWVAAKLVPVIVRIDPTGPDGMPKVEITGGEVKAAPLLAIPPTVTTMGPVVAPPGTVTVMLVEFQLEAAAANAPLNVTVLLPWLAPKFVPVMVTGIPTDPVVGFRPVMLGDCMTVKFTPLLATPPAVTTTLPVVAFAGTGVTMLVAVQLVGVAVVPLNVTVPVVPKFVPVMVIDAPTGPDVGFKVEIFGEVPPPLPAALKATICMIHEPELSVAVAL